jgi:DNA-binding transcriptional regulator YhcF (GntR family)
VPSIWDNNGFKPIHYRVLWWMIDMGAIQGALMRGWMNVCASDLKIHRITLNRVVRRLVESGFVRGGKRGTFALVESAFYSDADISRVHVLAEVENASKK